MLRQQLCRNNWAETVASPAVHMSWLPKQGSTKAAGNWISFQGETLSSAGLSQL